MNEKNYKIIVIGTILCFVVLLFLQSVVDGAAFRRADTKIDTLERELSVARERVADCTRELEDCRGTVDQCYNSVGRIADNLADDRAELSGIIENLKQVRKEVEDMENALNFFYVKYGYIDHNFDNNGGELE